MTATPATIRPGEIRNGPIPPDIWDEIDIHPDGDPLPLFPNGKVVQVRVAECRVRRIFDGWRAELMCEVLEDDRRMHQALGRSMVPMRLPLYVKLPQRRGSRGPFASAPLGSKFYRLWVFANRGTKPGRRDRMPLSIFRDRLFMAKTRVVTKDHNGADLPGDLHYSVIADFFS